mgnify:CR=1 FL=1
MRLTDDNITEYREYESNRLVFQITFTIMYIGLALVLHGLVALEVADGFLDAAVLKRGLYLVLTLELVLADVVFQRFVSKEVWVFVGDGEQGRPGRLHVELGVVDFVEQALVLFGRLADIAAFREFEHGFSVAP